MQQQYPFKEIEKHAQAYWDENQVFAAKINNIPDKQKITAYGIGPINKMQHTRQKDRTATHKGKAKGKAK